MLVCVPRPLKALCFFLFLGDAAQIGVCACWLVISSILSDLSMYLFYHWLIKSFEAVGHCIFTYSFSASPCFILHALSSDVLCTYICFLVTLTI